MERSVITALEAVAMSKSNGILLTSFLTIRSACLLKTVESESFVLVWLVGTPTITFLCGRNRA